MTASSVDRVAAAAPWPPARAHRAPHRRAFVWVYLALQLPFALVVAFEFGDYVHPPGGSSLRALSAAVNLGVYAGAWVLVDVVLGVGFCVWQLGSRD